MPALCSELRPLPAALLDPVADKVLSRVVVPNPARRVGEVRLLARGGAVVVQTLLSTKVMGRVVGEIRKKEEAAWPQGSAARADSESYVGALEALAKDLDSRQVTVNWAERRQRLLIEFVADDSSAGVILGSWDGDEVDGALEPKQRGTITRLVPNRDYVLRNMRLILIDSFHMADADLDRLGALGPVRAVTAYSAAGTPPPAAVAPGDRGVSP